MHRQLDQTAFFGTDRGKAGRRPRNGRHYKARGDQPACADVDACYVVGGASETAPNTLKVIPRLPVALVDQAAARALPARVAWVDQHHRHTDAPGLVSQQGALLVEAPVVQSCPLTPPDLNPVADALEVLEGHRRPVALGDGNDDLADAMVDVALETGLSARRTAQGTSGRTGSFFLQSPATGSVPPADILDLGTGEDVSAAAHGEVDDAQVDAEHIHRCTGGNILDVAGDGQRPLAAHEHQIDFAFGTGQHVTLLAAADERDALTTLQGPDRDGILAWKKAEDARVEGLCRVPLEPARLLPVADLEGVCHLGDATDGSLSGQAETGTQFTVAYLVQVVLLRDLRPGCKFGQPFASCVATLQCRAKQDCLLACRQQSECLL